MYLCQKEKEFSTLNLLFWSCHVYPFVLLGSASVPFALCRVLALRHNMTFFTPRVVVNAYLCSSIPNGFVIASEFVLLFPNL